VASATAHFIIGAALALPALKSRRLTTLLPAWALPVSAGLLAMLPDVDLAGRRLFGIRPSSLLSHRGLFHSPFFLILLAAVLALIVARGSSRKTFASLWLLWAGCMLTHPLLDALTDGGEGVMLLIPFARTRLYFPWHPIHTPGRSVHLLARAFLIRSSEIPFCAAALVAGVSGLFLRKSTRLKESL
jgi:inner membrane protein